MTVSGRKQSTAQVISNPPAPVARLEENGKECMQHMADNGKERGVGEKERRNGQEAGEGRGRVGGLVRETH